MNIIALTAADFANNHRNECVLRDDRATHILRTLKSKPGDTLRVGLIGDKLGNASITAIDEEHTTVNLQVTLNEAPPSPLPVTLLLALPRPKMLGRLLRDVTSLGIKNIHLFQSKKVEKSYWHTPSLAPDYVDNKLLEGLAQARDTIKPQVHLHKKFRDVMHVVVPDLLQSHTGVLADPFSIGADISSCSTQNLLLVIGPEGGFTEDERQQFLGAGCQPLWLGSRILRVETAVHVAIGHLGTKFGLP